VFSTDLVLDYMGCNSYLADLLGAELVKQLLEAEFDRCRSGEYPAFTECAFELETPSVDSYYVHHTPNLIEA
jgi:hypothetical protein